MQNPPLHRPHFGGAWERLFHSCKRTMYAIPDSRSITEETLLNTLCSVEQLLIARPLTCVRSEFQDIEVLTPNHFLNGRSPVFFPVDLAQPNDFSHRLRFLQAQCTMLCPIYLEPLAY